MIADKVLQERLSAPKKAGLVLGFAGVTISPKLLKLNAMGLAVLAIAANILAMGSVRCSAQRNLQVLSHFSSQFKRPQPLARVMVQSVCQFNVPMF